MTETFQKYFVRGLGAALFCLPVSLAFAEDSPASNLIGNTIVTIVGGMEYRSYYGEDGTFISDMGNFGGVVEGSWEVVGGQMCTTMNGGPQPGTRCSDIQSHEVGDEWEVDGMMGPMTMKLVEGKDF